MRTNMQPEQLPTPADLNEHGKHLFPGFLGIEMLSIEPDLLKARLPVHENLMANNGFLHAASVVALADTCCGYGTFVNLPAGALGFTTVELKSNFVGTVREGFVLCEAKPLHRGRSTQIWDAQVFNGQTNQAIAHFRCTQMIFWKQD